MKLKLLTVFFTFMSLMACKEEAKQADIKLLNTSWELKNYRVNGSLSRIQVPNDRFYTLHFLEANVVDVLEDCNSGSGKYLITGNKVSVTGVALTEMACIRNVENLDFVGNLSGKYEIGEDSLTIVSDEGLLMTFMKVKLVLYPSK